MKKILCFILSLIMCAILLAVASVAMDIPQISYRTYEDYWQFINENRLSDKFVYYESLKMFGDFDALRFHCDKPGCDECYYSYVIVDETGFDFSVYVSSDETYYNYIAELGRYDRVNIKTDDLRYYPYSKGQVIYDSNDVIYDYYDGNLKSIYWLSNNQIFQLYSYSLADYPTDTSTIIGRLLDKRTAPEVIELLKTHDFLGKPEAPIPPETADNSIIFSVLSVISAGGFTLFASKKPKKKIS